MDGHASDDARNGTTSDVAASPRTRAQLTAAKRADRRRFLLILTAMSAMLLIGVGLILYPTVADAWNRHVASRAVAGYVEQVENTSEEDRRAQLDEAAAYNEGLVGQGVGRFLPTPEEHERYESILDVTGTGIMGYVTIPKIKARLPIYHGTDETVLQIASGHLEGSSLPVGGESTHTVLTGHTGLPSAMLFTGLDTLGPGDRFTVTVYDDVLTYEVEDAVVVEPTDVDDLAIEEGRDLASLVTCTPYGVNSHRLIVTGHRVPTPEADRNAVFRDEALTQDIVVTAAIIVVVAAAIAVVFIVQCRRMANRPAHHANGR